MANINIQDNYRIAYFISPHGFGHAARSTAVMTALHEAGPLIQFDIFTKVPRWFFQQSLSFPFTYHSLLTDIGLVQKTPLHEDLHKTLQCLNEFLPFDRNKIKDVAKLIKENGCRMVICDIAPIGIKIAQAAKVPSMLIENFTWDWIYQGYTCPEFPLDGHINYLHNIFMSSDYYVQIEPVCSYYKKADLTTLPVSRSPKMPLQLVRQKLGIPDKAKVVTITMGGIPEQYMFLKQLRDQHDIYFVIPGSHKTVKTSDNVVLLPQCSDFFHPDLINASDAVIGKLGYSTLAEVYYAGVPFGYVPRAKFRESEIIEVFVKKEMSGFAITEEQFHSGDWIPLLPGLIALPKFNRNYPKGQIKIANFIWKILKK